MNKFRNNAKMVEIGNSFWKTAEQFGLAGIVASWNRDQLKTPSGHSFVNFSCCSYLDLDRHPQIIEGAINALRQYGALDHCITRARVQLPALSELEESLSELFGAQITSAITASVASCGVLPLVASGHLTGNERPIMVFDKNCHVSMLQVKPICADETVVETCAHHDLNYLEDHLKKNSTVCYVCDGSDSLGGYAPVAELSALQNRYGKLYLYYDDSHSLSANGKSGRGYVRSNVLEIGDKTIVVATLNKAFGTSGAVLMLGGRSHEEMKNIERYGGGLGYSQPMNTAAVGASLASAEIHRSEELVARQEKLQRNIELFDSLVQTKQTGSLYPIRLVDVPDDEVISLAAGLFEQGYYVSPVFFPVVARGTAGLRVMLRTGHTETDIATIATAIANIKTTRELTVARVPEKA